MMQIHACLCIILFYFYAHTFLCTAKDQMLSRQPDPQVSEIMVYNAAITDSLRLSIETYFRAKYSLY